MFMFCRLAMMKEFLFMSGLEEPSYTHPARAPHTHTPDSLRQARPPRWTRISSSAMMDHRYWWSCSLKRHPHPLWHLLINAYTSSCERLLLFPSSVTVVSLALVLSLWAICLAWFSLSPFFFLLCGDWDYDVIYSCWGSHARSLCYLPHFPYEQTSTCICCVSDAGVPTKLF